jgi:hypothetical protein
MLSKSGSPPNGFIRQDDPGTGSEAGEFVSYSAVYIYTPRPARTLTTPRSCVPIASNWSADLITVTFYPTPADNGQRMPRFAHTPQ